MSEPALLSLGQLSVWQDIRYLPPSRRHEPNNAAVWTIPQGVHAEQVGIALRTVVERHPSLRTRYDLTERAAPRQLTPDAEFHDSLTTLESADRPQEIAADLAARPFDLGREHGWRARLLTCHDAPTHVVFIKHHIVADAWAQELLHREFLTALTRPGGLKPAPPGPADLAADQYSQTGRRRQAAALAHWQHTLESAPAHISLPRRAPGAGGATESSADALQCTLHSAPARSAAHAIAERAQVSVAAVVLSAYVRSVARLCGTDRLLTQLMCANRFTERWKNVVTSMNQWVPAVVDHAMDDDLIAVARTAHWNSLTAFRHGMHDVTAVEALRDRMRHAPEPVCAFNHVAVPDGPPGPGEEADTMSATGPRIDWEEPFTTIGPRCYARALETSSSLSVRLTAKDVAREQAEALLRELHDALLTTAERI
ncbi:condensation domain-containing protein [Streptomyces sp. RB6PN25]|uniref:Condensation domain-containing protein n=1 Tax=Streptomyces humicola TaxID=2953240 RepID=A0ABT1PVP7_9ACTN|nr:condensation domain-containing protein [Streptomyces humicola]MCQ4081085.1 condensation domain-containing protein [Streptomyces humicola]